MRKKLLKRFAALTLSVAMLGSSVMTGTYASADKTVYESAAPYAAEVVADAEKADAKADDEAGPQASVRPSETPEADGQASMPKDTKTPAESTEDAAKATEDAAKATDPAAEAKETKKPESTATPKPTETDKPEVTETPEATEAATVKAEDVTPIQDYIKENIDTRYADADQFVAMDILLVKQTLADGSALSGELTIDNMWSSEKNAEAFLKMDQVCMYLYDVDQDSDYFVALADTMHKDDTCTVTDYAFAYTNLRGEEADDCIYDKKTGLAYVPKRYTVENKNELGAMNIQLQLLQSCKTDEPTTDVTVEVDSEVKGDVADSGSATVDAMDFSTSIQLAEDKKARSNIREDKITVAVNDVEVEKFNYNEDTGVLTVALPPTTIETLEVAVEKETFMEKVAGVLSDIKAAAASLFVTKAEAITASAAVSWNALSDSPIFTFSVAPSAGTVVEIGCDLYYSGTSYHVTNTYGLAESGSGTVQEKVMWEVIQGNQADSGYNYVVIDSEKNDLYFIAKFGTASSAKVTAGSGTVALNGVNADAILACAHVTNTWGYAGAWIQDQPGNTISTNLRVKVLATGSDSKGAYMVAGIYTKADGTAGGSGQTGVGFVKMYYKVTPQTTEHKVVKKWTYPTSTYGTGTIYGDKNKPSIPTSVDVVLLRDGSAAAGSTRTLNADNKWSYTYTGQPIKNNSGKTIVYSAKEATDNSAWEAKTSGNKTTLTTITNTAKYGFLRVKKRVVVDPDNGYTGAGADYGVYYSASDANNKRNLITTLTTTSTPHAVSGEANTYDYYSQAIAVWPGTYYIKELTSPAGYQLDKTVHAVTVDAAKHCATHDGAANLVQTATSEDEPKYGRIILYKGSKPLPEGTHLDVNAYSLKGAVYGVYTDEECTDRVDTISVDSISGQTDENGLFICYGMSKDLPLGGEDNPYYVKEMIAPEGFGVDPKAYPVVLKDDGKTETVFAEHTAEDWLMTVKVKLQKVSAEPDVTDYREEYSLKGAVYKMYYGTTWENAQNAGAKKTYKTAADGTFTTSPLTLTMESDAAALNRYYYFKETAPSPGYAADPDIYRIRVKTCAAGASYVEYAVWYSSDNGETWKLQSSGLEWTEYDSTEDAWVAEKPVPFISTEPLLEPVAVRLMKESSMPEVSGKGYGLSGAVYTMYKGTSWIDATGLDDDGYGGDEWQLAIEDAGYWMDALYAGTDYTTEKMTDADGNPIYGFTTEEFPVAELEDGAPVYYYFIETKAPDGYFLDETIYRVRITGGDGIKVRYRIDKSDKPAGEWDGETMVVVESNQAEGIDVGEPVTFTSKEEPEHYKVGFEKKSANPEVTDGNPEYALAGAVYAMYAGADKEGMPDWDRANWLEDFTTNALGRFTTGTVPYDTDSWYYFRETQAPEKFRLDKNIYAIRAAGRNSETKQVLYETMTSSDDGKTWIRGKSGAVGNGGLISFTSVEPVVGMKLRLEKVSANEPLTDGNACYSLADAEYTLYCGSTFAEAVKEAPVLVLKTGENGIFETDETNELMLPEDGEYYYLTETKASKGYELDPTIWKLNAFFDASSNVAYILSHTEKEEDGSYNTDEAAWEADTDAPVILGEDDYVVVTSKEKPANDPFALILSKKGSETDEAINGAVFELKYYDNTDNDTIGDALRTWYFTTDKDGKLNCSDADYLVKEGAQLNDGTELYPDELYKDDAGGVIYPVGTYLFKEIQSGDGYTLDGGEMWLTCGKAADVVKGIMFSIERNDTLVNGMYGATIYDIDGNGVKGEISADNFSIEATNTSIIRLRIIKLGSDGKPLAGVIFKLVGDDDQEYTAVSDENGEVTFENITPQHYTLTEVSTVGDYTLLEGSVSINVPLYMTKEEIIKTGADISKAKYSMTENKYFFTEQTYTICNGEVIDMPFTGMSSSAKIYITLFCGFVLFGIASEIAFRITERKKRK